MSVHVQRQIAIYALTAVTLLVHFDQSTSAGTQFPTCVNVTQKCATLGGCVELPNSFAYTGEHSKNLLCINQTTDSSPVIRSPYQLRGCPTEFFNTYQSTSGVCSVRTDNGTDLILAVNEMAPGLHSFSCMVPEAPNEIVTSYAVIVNDTVYRDFRIIINGLLQYYHNSTNITLDVGSNLTVVVLAVGNVSVINASDPRFICETNFACSHNPDGLSNRYLKCSLRTPAELSDDGRSLLVSIDNNEMFRFLIAVNQSSSVADEEGEEVDEGGINGATSVDPSVSAYVIVGSVIIVMLIIIITVAIIMYCLHKERCSQDVMEHVEEGCHIEREVFKQYYGKLANILPVTNILHKLIPEGIITTGDIEEISDKPRSKDKALFILNKIDRSLEANANKSFNVLLDIMEECGNDDVRDIVIDMRRTLMNVLILCCPNCDQLWDEIKSHGYTIKKIPTKTGNNLRTSLDQGIPLVMCSCSECEIPREMAQVFSSPILCSWNALQLHQADSGNILPSNGVVQVTVTDLDNGRAMSEVLAWLETKLPRRSSSASSVTSQRGSHYSLGQSGE